MGRIAYLLAAWRMPQRIGGAAARADAEAIRIATTAIASAGFVLTTGLIAMASAATLQIGPFKARAAHNPELLPRLVEEADSVSARGFVAAAAAPAYALMLIAEDPGADAWQRMLAGGLDGPAATPIRVAPVGAVSSLVAMPVIASRVMPAPPSWTKLSALEGAWSWEAIVAGADAAQASLFSKLPTGPAAEAAPPPAPAAETPAPATSQPPAATTAPATDPKPAQPATNTATPTPTPPLASVPPVIVAPPTQVTPPPIVPPPGSGDPPPPPISPVPEPGVWTYFIVGFGLIGFSRRQRRRSPAF